MSNTTFAVAASDEVIAEGRTLLKQLTYTGEKQEDGLKRIFKIANNELEDRTLMAAGVDTKALEASIDNVRAQFTALAAGENEIIAKKDALILELKDEKSRLEEEYRGRLAETSEAQKKAEEEAREAVKDAEQAKKDADAAREQAATATALVNEKDKTIRTLAGQLSAAEEKAKNYDAIAQSKAKTEKQVNDLTVQLREQKSEYEHQMESLRKDQETQVRELNAEMGRKVSDAKKDADLACEKALAEKERELNAAAADQLRKADREIARLQVLVEDLQDQIRKLRPKQKQTRDDQSDRDDAAVEEPGREISVD